MAWADDNIAYNAIDKAINSIIFFHDQMTQISGSLRVKLHQFLCLLVIPDIQQQGKRIGNRRTSQYAVKVLWKALCFFECLATTGGATIRAGCLP